MKKNKAGFLKVKSKSQKLINGLMNVSAGNRLFDAKIRWCNASKAKHNAIGSTYSASAAPISEETCLAFRIIFESEGFTLSNSICCLTFFLPNIASFISISSSILWNTDICFVSPVCWAVLLAFSAGKGVSIRTSASIMLPAEARAETCATSRTKMIVVQ